MEYLPVKKKMHLWINKSSSQTDSKINTKKHNSCWYFLLYGL